MPSPSGPRCANRLVSREISAGSIALPRKLTMPAIPHIPSSSGKEASGRKQASGNRSQVPPTDCAMGSESGDGDNHREDDGGRETIETQNVPPMRVALEQLCANVIIEQQRGGDPRGQRDPD